MHTDIATWVVIIPQLHPILAIRINSVLTVNNQRRGGIDTTVVVIILARVQLQ